MWHVATLHHFFAATCCSVLQHATYINTRLQHTRQRCIVHHFVLLWYIVLHVAPCVGAWFGLELS